MKDMAVTACIEQTENNKILWCDWYLTFMAKASILLFIGLANSLLFCFTPYSRQLYSFSGALCIFDMLLGLACVSSLSKAVITSASWQHACKPSAVADMCHNWKMYTSTHQISSRGVNCI